MVHRPGFEGRRARVAQGAIIGSGNMATCRIDFAQYRPSWAEQLMCAIMASHACCLALRMIEWQLGGRPTRVVGNVAVFASISGCHMWCIFASDRLGSGLVAAVMAGNANWRDEIVEVGKQRRPDGRAVVAAGASSGTGIDMCGIAARGAHAVVTGFAGGC